MSIILIKETLNNINKTDVSALQQFILKYSEDSRSGVLNLVKKASYYIDAIENEKIRTDRMYRYEKENWGKYNYIAGIDEVGRGPLAGPVVTCGVILPKNEQILYLDDSKKLSKATREKLYDIIIEKAVSFCIGIADEKTIDKINILQATYKAMTDSVNGLKTMPDLLLNDAVKIPGIDIMQIPIVKGDTLSASIAAASIVAKVTRDKIMENYSEVYPEYDFHKNMGYGSKMHIEMIKKYGPCEIHRKSFIKNFI